MSRAGPSKKKGAVMSERKVKLLPLQHRHRAMLQRRGVDPKNYALIKETYSSVYLRDLRDGSLKILYKFN
jgi:hypothetical protein